jgi:hypothetical protein
MNYQKVHDQIIFRGKNSGRKILPHNHPDYIYLEKHHIIPRCMNGDNSPENLVLLTAREHFLIHWLLHRIYPENKSIGNAFFMNCHGTEKQLKYRQETKFTISSRAYAEAKKAVVIMLRSRKNYKHSEETKKKQSVSAKKKIVTKEQIEKLHQGNYRASREKSKKKGRIQVFDFKKEEFITEYESALETSKKLKVAVSRIFNVIKGKENLCKGYFFVKEENSIFPSFEETILKIKSRKKVIKHNLNLKSGKVKVYKYPSMEFVGEYYNITECQKELNVTNISQVLLGRTNQAKGYYFERKESRKGIKE